jgi:hypothetical protein
MKNNSIWVVTLTSKASDFVPQEIEGLPSPTNCTESYLMRGGPSGMSQHPVLCSSPVQPLLIDDSVPFLMGYGIAMNSAMFRQKYARPRDFTSAMSCFVFFVEFSRGNSCQTGILRYLRKGFHGHIPHRTSTLGIIFCGVI